MLDASDGIEAAREEMLQTAYVNPDPQADCLIPPQMLEAWRSGVRESMPGIADTVRALAARGVRFSYMSDISPIHLDQVFKYCGFAHLVSGGIYSFEAGAFKLDGYAMFEAFERRYGRPLVFFDDRIEIIEHARELGWNAIRFESPERALQDATALLD